MTAAKPLDRLSVAWLAEPICKSLTLQQQALQPRLA